MDNINGFLKLKSKACGNPGSVHRPEDDEKYVEPFCRREWIRTEKEAIRYNAAKRGQAKLRLNSTEGTLTNRNDRLMTKVFTVFNELYGFPDKLGIEVMNLVFANNELVSISWKYGLEEHVPSLRHTNEVIGTYVTAGARIHLPLSRTAEGERDFFDTDSLIYIQPRNEPQLIETGDNLGVMTSVLRPSESLSKFLSGGRNN